jgi:apyrase
LTAGSSKNGTLVDPCAPKGYSHKRRVTVKTSGASRSNLENQYVDNGSGNFKECRSSSLMIMQEGKGKKCMRTL